ncbi:MAG: ROK family protein [Verrucomicrobia bacterium]|nr:MAG: ROK family protein [Verrucomicrobiota bacterium]
MATDYLGIEIGGTKLQLILGRPGAEPVLRRRWQVEAAAGAAALRERLEATLPELLEVRRPAAVGVGFGGPVEPGTGRICRSHQVPGWDGFPLGEWLRGITGLPVVVENDANTAALAEARLGAGRGRRVVLYVTLGSGVGGGLVVDGGIYHGAPPGECEIGHVRLARGGPTVEERCSGWAVDRRIRAWVAGGAEGTLAELARREPGHEARHLGPALAAGEPAARQLLDEVAGELAFGLSHAVHLFHPEVIVLGGGLSLVGEPLRAAVAAALPELLMEAFRPGPEVRLAALGEEVVPQGALLLAAGVAPAAG